MEGTAGRGVPPHRLGAGFGSVGTPLSERLALGALLLLFIAALAHVSPLVATGDEPRYLDQAARDLRAVHATRASRPALPFGTPASARPAVSVVLSAVYATALGLGGVVGARVLSAAFVVFGLALFWSTVRSDRLRARPGKNVLPALATGLVAFSVPLVEYAQLVYPEALLFFLTSVAVWALTSQTLRRLAWSLPAAAVMPFVHVRTVPLAVACHAIAVAICWRTSRRRAFGYAGLALLGGLGFAAFQVAVYGSLAGTAFASYPATVGTLLPRLAMQLFDVRHGIVVYWPLALLGGAGLLAGVVRRDAACASCAALLVAYVVPFLWATASESYSCRYWVCTLPLFGYGIAFWLARARTRLDWLAFAPVAAASAGTLAIFLLVPHFMLDDRRESLAMSFVSRFVPFDFGVLLPVDAGPEAGALPSYARPALADLAFASVLVVALAARTSLSARGRAVALAVIVVQFGALALYAHVVAAPAVAIAPKGPGRTEYRLGGVAANALRFGDAAGLSWATGGVGRTISVGCRPPHGPATVYTSPSRPLVTFPPCAAGSVLSVSFAPAPGRGTGPATNGTLFRSGP